MAQNQQPQPHYPPPAQPEFAAEPTVVQNQLPVQPLKTHPQPQPLQYQQLHQQGLLASQFLSPLCGCFDDMATCCEVYFCHCVTHGRISAASQGRTDTIDPVCCCLGLLFPICTEFVLRGQTRSRYNIQGDACGDFCTALCCLSCSTCQLANEHNRRGTNTGALCCAPSLGPMPLSMGAQMVTIAAPA